MNTDASRTGQTAPLHTGQPLSWTTLAAEAKRLGAGRAQLYRAARAGTLRTVRINGRGDMRTLSTWVDEWLLGMQRPYVVDARHDYRRRQAGDID